jgi:hypothetical protein
MEQVLGDHVGLTEHLARRGWNRVAVVCEGSIIGRASCSLLEDAAALHGIEIVATIDLDVKGLSGPDAAAGVDRAEPEIVASLGFPSAAGCATAMSGRSLPVISNSALLMGHSYPDLAAGVEGWTYVDVFDEDNVERQAFLALCADEPSSLPPAVFDTARLGAHGLLHAPNLDANGVRLGLERVKRVPAVIGEQGTIAGLGQWKRSALEGGYLVLRQWADGRSIRVPAPPDSVSDRPVRHRARARVWVPSRHQGARPSQAHLGARSPDGGHGLRGEGHRADRAARLSSTTRGAQAAPAGAVCGSLQTRAGASAITPRTTPRVDEARQPPCW